MKLLSVKVSNWGPHKHWECQIPQHSRTIALCAENDSGKSWILRAIGFALSIGRNSYGDQTSILSGESQAEVEITFQHNGQLHTINKIIRNKDSETEGTETKINGEKADTQKMADFFQQIGLSHPETWLPITIAMQNQTDAHLRSKKSEREEALRSLVNLDKTDAWKEALREKANDFERSILEERNQIRGELSSLERQNKDLSEEKAKLETTLHTLNFPFGPDGPEVLNNIEAAKAWEQTFIEYKRLDTLLLNKDRELSLAETQETRIREALKTLNTSLPEPEYGETLEKEIQRLEKEKLSRKLKKLEQELSEIKQDISTKSKLLLQLPTLSENEVKTLLLHLETLQEKTIKLTSLSERVSTLKEKIKGLQDSLKSDEINTLLENLANTPPETLLQKLEALLESAKIYEKENQKLAILLEEGKRTAEQLGLSTNPYLALTQAREEIQEITSSQRTLLAKTLLLESLENPHTTNCPCCDRPLPETLKKEGLLQEIHAIEPNLTQQLHRMDLLKKELKTLEAWAVASKTQPYPTQNLETLEKIKNLLEEYTQITPLSQTLQKQIQTIKTSYFSQEDQSLSLPILKEKYQNLQNKVLEKKALLQATQLLRERLKEKLDFFEETETLFLEKSGEPLPELSLEELDNRIKSTKERLLTWRQKQKELSSLQNQLREAEAKTNAERAAKKELLEKKLATEIILEDGLQMQYPKNQIPSTIEKWGELKSLYLEKYEAIQRIRPILDSLPPKINALQQRKEELEKGLKEIDHKTRKLESAKKLISFLDYKNAPRKLLEHITQKLFERTNQLATELEAEIQLKLGKNLDFLTYQQRAGRWIEQKTERLGFGKGAILGICFRLACIKLLLKQTGFLILDEPTANVDAKRKSALKAFLQRLTHQPHSGVEQIILIEHDEDVVSLCDTKIQVRPS